jgi:hypothetical protein
MSNDPRRCWGRITAPVLMPARSHRLNLSDDHAGTRKSHMERTRGARQLSCERQPHVTTVKNLVLCNLRSSTLSGSISGTKGSFAGMNDDVRLVRLIRVVPAAPPAYHKRPVLGCVGRSRVRVPRFLR